MALGATQNEATMSMDLPAWKVKARERGGDDTAFRRAAQAAVAQTEIVRDGLAAQVKAALPSNTEAGKVGITTLLKRFFARGSGLKGATRKAPDHKTPTQKHFLAGWFGHGSAESGGSVMKPETAVALFESMRDPECPEL